jgi:C4-dicarboxylate-binding protein DctP
MENIKTSTKLIVAAVVAIGLSALIVISEKEIVMKFSHVATEDTPKGQGALLFQKLVKERLDGKVRIKIYPNSQLFDDNNVLDALLENNVQLAAPALSKFTEYTQKWALFDLPFLFKNPKAFSCFARSEKGQALLNTMEQSNIKGLKYWPSGMKQLSANTPLITPEDAKGLKFRIMNSDVLKAQFKAVGASSQKMGFIEVYNALSAGVVDGQENTWSSIRSKEFFKLQKDITVSNHGILGFALVVNKNFWDDLPDNIRTQLNDIITEVTDKVAELSLDASIKDRHTIANYDKTTIHTLTNNQKQQWIDAMKPVWAQFEDQVGKDNIEAVQQCNAKN